jgi:hypothetical protein
MVLLEFVSMEAVVAVISCFLWPLLCCASTAGGIGYR